MGGFGSPSNAIAAQSCVSILHTAALSTLDTGKYGLGLLFYLASTRRRSVKADHIFIPTVRQHFTIDSLGATYGLRWACARSPGTVHGAFKCHAHFILILVLLSRQVNQQNNKSDACDNE